MQVFIYIAVLLIVLPPKVDASVCERLVSRLRNVVDQFSTRILGEFDLINHAGKVINVRFVSSVHEGGASRVKGELDFLERIFDSKFKSPSSMLVEQGEGIAMNNLTRYLAELSSNGKVSVSSTFPRRFKAELDYIAERAHEKGIEAINFDLAANPEAIGYCLRKFGQDYAIRVGALLLNNYNLTSAEAKLVFNAIVEAQALKISPVLVNSVFEPFYSKLILDPVFAIHSSNAHLSNRLRETFMAEAVAKADGNVFVVAHTRHILGVIAHLKANIQSLVLNDSESVDSVRATWKKFEEQGSLERIIDGLKRDNPSIHDSDIE